MRLLPFHLIVGAGIPVIPAFLIVGVEMCIRDSFGTAQENFEVANYASAITNLKKVMQMDEGYNDGAAMLLLAQSYDCLLYTSFKSVIRRSIFSSLLKLVR